ncbi:hypothetical protein MIND_00548600 [Mycena indigotica]|uniref:DASH complex subunit ASK1 n=1 Tax=Mycena indigotica TaxID=2126181 RepID=A0A8H6SYB6_9AGAR|nr:uncharacterized protein MIND_00548600 [Mycena indigotica]KAF7307538.1 hypothetical protein MIND_00548600 [Mycena indigotica]
MPQPGREGRRSPVPNPPRWQPNPTPASIIVPGVDGEAALLDQIEQIEQLITLKLQGIDENFAKIHNVLTTRILPSVKRYAVATKPVRESAKFWISFYEKAAQIRIPTAEDYSTVNDAPSDRQELEGEAESSGQHTADSQEHSIASTEQSFMPHQAAFASTPAIDRVGRSTTNMDDSELPSWSASIESPVTRLARNMESYEREESSRLPSLHLGSVLEEEDEVDNTIVRPRKDKGKEPMLQNVLRHTLYSKNDDVSFVSMSPAKGKLRTPIPAKLNPYIPSGTEPANWSGVVNLRQTPLSTTPRKQKQDEFDDDDDWVDGLPPGMSPLKIMSPARPPPSKAELQLLHNRPPAKEAAARIKNDLVREAQNSRRYQGGVESSLSTLASPPSLSKYNRAADTDESVDTSLESVMRRVSLNPKTWTPGGGTPGLRLKAKHNAPTFTRPVPPPEPIQYHPPPIFNPPPITPMQFNQGDDSFGSESESMVQEQGQIQAMMMNAQATSASAASGTSYDSDDSVSFDAGQQEAMNVLMNMGGQQQFVGGYMGDDSFDDDSFEDDMRVTAEEETIFGRPPQARFAPRMSAAGDLLMYGDEASILPDTEQFGLVGSPTPAGRG